MSEQAIDGKCKMDDDIDPKQDEKSLMSSKSKRDDGDNDDTDDQDSSQSPWVNELPDEIMEEILGKMRLSDCALLFGVCQPWKEVAMQQYIQPYLVNLPYNRWLFDPWVINVKNCKKMDIRHPILDEKFCVGASHGWLILKQERSAKVCLTNLFNGAKFNLPKWIPKFFSGNIFLSSSPTSDNCTVLVIGKYVTGLGFCRIGDSKWTIKKYQPLTQSSECRREYLEQAVAVGERFYVLTSLARLAAIDDVRHPRMVSIVGGEKVVPKREVFRCCRYLVESEGQILVVLLCIPGLVRAIDHVEVFRYDFECSAWLQMEKLDGRTLFVGLNCSFAVRSDTDFVFFPDNSSDGWRKYDMERKQVIETQSFEYRFPSDLRDRVWILPTLEYPA